MGIFSNYIDLASRLLVSFLIPLSRMKPVLETFHGEGVILSRARLSLVELVFLSLDSISRRR